jgi:hypothetical protein
MWLMRRKYSLHTKAVLLFNMVCIVTLCHWSFIRVRADYVRFKNVGEIWAYETYFELLICQQYRLPFTFISDPVPQPKLFLFWCLFTTSGESDVGCEEVSWRWSTGFTVAEKRMKREQYDRPSSFAFKSLEMERQWLSSNNKQTWA